MFLCFVGLVGDTCKDSRNRVGECKRAVGFVNGWCRPRHDCGIKCLYMLCGIFWWSPSHDNVHLFIKFDTADNFTQGVTIIVGSRDGSKINLIVSHPLKDDKLLDFHMASPSCWMLCGCNMQSAVIITINCRRFFLTDTKFIQD